MISLSETMRIMTVNYSPLSYRRGLSLLIRKLLMPRLLSRLLRILCRQLRLHLRGHFQARDLMISISFLRLITLQVLMAAMARLMAQTQIACMEQTLLPQESVAKVNGKPSLKTMTTSFMKMEKTKWEPKVDLSKLKQRSFCLSLHSTYRLELLIF